MAASRSHRTQSVPSQWSFHTIPHMFLGALQASRSNAASDHMLQRRWQTKIASNGVVPTHPESSVPAYTPGASLSYPYSRDRAPTSTSISKTSFTNKQPHPSIYPSSNHQTTSDPPLISQKIHPYTMPPSARSQPSKHSHRPSPPLRERSDEYHIPAPSHLVSLPSYISNPPFQSLIPIDLAPHIIHIVRTSERQPPIPNEPDIGVFVTSRRDKNHTTSNINAQTGNHTRTGIRCLASTTITELKGKVALRMGVGVEGMVLRRWGGEPGLCEGLGLGDYGIGDGDMLEVEVGAEVGAA